MASGEGGRQGGEAWQRGKRTDGITRVEPGEFGSSCGGGGGRLSVADGASAGSTRQERGRRLKDAGAGPGLRAVLWTERESRGSSSETGGRGCLINGQGDGAAGSVACIAAGSAFTESVQQLGQS